MTKQELFVIIYLRGTTMKKEEHNILKSLKASTTFTYETLFLQGVKKSIDEHQVSLFDLCLYKDHNIRFDFDNDIITIPEKGAILGARHISKEQAKVWLKNEQSELPEYNLELVKCKIPTFIPNSYYGELGSLISKPIFSNYAICITNYEKFLKGNQKKKV